MWNDNFEFGIVVPPTTPELSHCPVVWPGLATCWRHKTAFVIHLCMLTLISFSVSQLLSFRLEENLRPSSAFRKLKHRFFSVDTHKKRPRHTYYKHTPSKSLGCVSKCQTETSTNVSEGAERFHQRDSNVRVTRSVTWGNRCWSPEECGSAAAVGRQWRSCSGKVCSAALFCH